MVAGFPLTDAELSTSYTVLSAHAPDKIDWKKYAQMDTLVLLMAANNLRTVMQHLLDSAWSPETPVSMTELADTCQHLIACMWLVAPSCLMLKGQDRVVLVKNSGNPSADARNSHP